MIFSKRNDSGPYSVTNIDTNELARLRALLEGCLANDNMGGFFQAIRTTTISSLAALCTDPESIFRSCYRTLHAFGSVSPAAAQAVENHLYVTASMASFPVLSDPIWNTARYRLLSRLRDGGALIANTSSQAHGSVIGRRGTTAKRVPGGLTVAGTALYASLASHCDLFLLRTDIDGEGEAYLLLDSLSGTPGVAVGPLVFPRAMTASDTRTITFDNAFLGQDCIALSPSSGALPLFSSYSLAWHQTLIGALYLGAAARALEETRAFLRTHSRDGIVLAESEAAIVEFGKMALSYRAAQAAVLTAGEHLAGITGALDLGLKVRSSYSAAMTAKYLATNCAESLVSAARRIIGNRTFMGDHPLERLSTEVMFGVLSPESAGHIERAHGRRCLVEDSLLESLLHTD